MDELSSFVFRTTGWNSIRTLSARLQYFAAVSGGLLSTLPLELRLRGKSTAQSHRAAIFYVDMTVRTGMSLAQAIAAAKAESEDRKTAGFDQGALDASARMGFAAGAFEESQEEGVAVVQEFYPQDDDWTVPTETPSSKPGLAEKLGQKLENRHANPLTQAQKSPHLSQAVAAQVQEGGGP